MPSTKKASRPKIEDGSIENLCRMMARADKIDRYEGKLAYIRYREVMEKIADKYAMPLGPVTAAFVATSPNNDYIGNLRSLISILEGIAAGLPVEDITISTFKHCRDRAYLYLTGEVDFLSTVKGKKIRAFYQNIMDPLDPEPVTIDGHMVAAWMNNEDGMRENIIRPRDYDVVADAVRLLAAASGLLANQVQSTIWFTRKRVLNVKYDPQGSLEGWFAQDMWKTSQNIDDLKPYPRKEKA